MSDKNPTHLVTVLRGSEIDMLHFGVACLVDADGKSLWSLGDTDTFAFIRSSAKPLQALPILASGVADAFGLDDADLAIICGSHHGGPAQATQVAGILRKCGLTEKHLGCGDGLVDQCSGKHAGMLAFCKHLNLPIENYLEPSHPLQTAIQDIVAGYCGLARSDLKLAVDGCSAPTFAMPVRNMAIGFARMAREAAINERSGPARLLKCMAAHPDHTGEPDLRSYAIRSHTHVTYGNPNGRPGIGSGLNVADLFTKGGANGLLCAAIPGLGLGFAMKALDGGILPRWPVLIGALERNGLLSSDEAERMRGALIPRIATRKGKTAGEIRLAF